MDSDDSTRGHIIYMKRCENKLWNVRKQKWYNQLEINKQCQCRATMVWRKALTHWVLNKMAANLHHSIFHEYNCVLMQVGLKFVPKHPIDYTPTLVRTPYDVTNLLVHVVLRSTRAGNGVQWNFNQNTTIRIQESEFQNIVCKMLTDSSRSQRITEI